MKVALSIPLKSLRIKPAGKVRWRDVTDDELPWTLQTVRFGIFKHEALFQGGFEEGSLVQITSDAAGYRLSREFQTSDTISQANRKRLSAGAIKAISHLAETDTDFFLYDPDVKSGRGQPLALRMTVDRTRDSVQRDQPGPVPLPRLAALMSLKSPTKFQKLLRASADDGTLEKQMQLVGMIGEPTRAALRLALDGGDGPDWLGLLFDGLRDADAVDLFWKHEQISNLLYPFHRLDNEAAYVAVLKRLQSFEGFSANKNRDLFIEQCQSSDNLELMAAFEEGPDWTRDPDGEPVVRYSWQS